MQFDKKYVPSKALIFYGSNLGNETLIEERRIIDGKLSAGKPVDLSSFEKYAAELLKKEENTVLEGDIPQNLIKINAKGNGCTLWWKTPKGQRQMYFDVDMGIESGMYPVPDLIWKYNTKLSILEIVAECGEENYYYGPIPNNSDTFCFGNAEPKKKQNIAEIIKEVESCVFENSIFTHFTNKTKLSTSKYGKLLGKKEFPIELLVKRKWKI
jgi:hypothetical protein